MPGVNSTLTERTPLIKTGDQGTGTLENPSFNSPISPGNSGTLVSSSSSSVLEVDSGNASVVTPGTVDYENLPPFGHEHYSHRAPWLRAAVLGANDGLVSTASLMLGIAAADGNFWRMISTGVAGLTAGSCSMALGEFVSVHSQKDAEESDVRREREEFMKGPLHAARELEELAMIYQSRGLSANLSRQIAEELHSTGDLDRIVKFHIRDELAIDTDELSNPSQAAIASALSFAMGGAVPLLASLMFANVQGGDKWEAQKRTIVVVATAASCGLFVFGLVGAVLGGATKWKAALRVLVGGWLAMAVTYAVGSAFGVEAS